MHQDWIRHEHAKSWSALTRELALCDDTEEFYDEEDLLEELREPGMVPEKDTLGLWDNGTMIGYGQLRLALGLRDGRGRVTIGGGISPAFRRRGYGSEIMQILEDRAARKMAKQHPKVDYTIDMWGNAPGHSAGALAVARGYEPARYFEDMMVGSDGFTPVGRPAAKPLELNLVSYSPEVAEPVRILDNEAFADHWGSAPKSREEWAAMTGARSFRNEFSRVLLEELGNGEAPRPLCYVLSGQWVANELYISRVGTARSSRGRGYAAWALSEVVASAFSAGFAKVDLSVDAQSPTGASGLYKRLGFDVVRQGVVFRKTCLAS